MKKKLRNCVLLGFILALAVPMTGAIAEASGTIPGTTMAELFPWAELDPAIPTLEAVTGVKIGSRALRHSEVMEYLTALAEVSPRARLQSYAESHEGRKLVILAVSSEDVVADLEGFRRGHARRMDPRGRSAGEDKEVLAGAKSVAWMGYAIHGDELSSTDAAVALAYWLVAGEDDRARAIREGLVVVIDPLENPDGRERFLAQTEAFAHKRPNPDKEDLSHTTVWPWGRGNHYLFDLNRDWFSQIHPESTRSQVMATWSPQLVIDCHEMGADESYLFSPPRAPFNPFLPEYERPWWDRFAADQGRALDQRGYGYFRGEWNEEFFPGYGNSWPAYHGAVAMLYEMGGTEGTLVKRHDGIVRTFAEAVEHHVVSSVANLETLISSREALLRDFVAARRKATESPAGPARAWILPPLTHSPKTDQLALLLRRNGLDVYRAEKGVRLGGLRDMRSGEETTQDLPEGTWMVPLDQPLSGLASVLLDPHVPMDKAYLREERENIEKGEGSRLYDMTAWSLPLLFGVEAFWTAKRPTGPWSLEGESQALEGRVEDGPQVYGYLLSGSEGAAMGALSHLLQDGIKVQVAEKPFRIAGREYSRGSLLIRKEGNPSDLGQRLLPVAKHWGVTFRPTATADSEKGPDLGGGHFLSLKHPRVGILTGMPISPSDYGSLWYVLDQRVELRFNALDLGFFPRLDLSRYNVLVFPPIMGGSDSYRRVLGQDGLEALKAWVEAGGTAVGIASGALFLADTDTELTSTRLRRQALDRYPVPVLGAPAVAVEAAAPLRAVGLRSRETQDAKASATLDLPPMIGPGARSFAPGVSSVDVVPATLTEWLEPTLPQGRDEPTEEELEAADARLRSFGPRGALLRVELDASHFMNWGLGDEASVLLRATHALVADNDVDVTARFSAPDRLHLGGLLWPEAAGRLAHTAYATSEDCGQGQVILFLGHPTFRAWTLETQRMFLNAVILGPGLGTDWPTPW